MAAGLAHRTHSYARAFVMVLAFVLAIVALTSCKSDQAFAVGSFTASNSSSPNAPNVLARWDGDTLVGWANTYAVVEVFPKGSSVALFGPVSIPAGKVIVYQRSSSFHWDADFPARLPELTRSLFRQNEIDAWSLEFEVVGQ